MFLKIIAPLVLAGMLQSSTAQKIKTTEKFICEMYTSEMVDPSISISNDMRRVSFRIKDGKKQVAVIDGTRGKAYDYAGMPVFSQDSKHYAYVARNGSSWFIVLNGAEQPAGAVNDVRGLQFLSNNRSLMYVATDANGEYLVMDGVKGKAYSFIDENSIRFNEQHKMAYAARQGKAQYMVFDGKESASYDRVSFPVFSAKGNTLAFTAKKNGKEFAVINDRDYTPYDSVEAVILDDKGEHYIYHVVEKGKEFVVRDGKEGKRYLFVHSLLISNDGSKVIYAVETETKNSEGFFHNVVINDENMPTYETVVESSLRLSNDNKRLAYEAEWHDEFFVVLDGNNGKHFGDVIQSTITFSPNSKRIAYAAENESKRTVTIDGVEGLPYDDVYSMMFTKDSKHAVYVARKGNMEFVVVDKVKGNPYNSIIGQGGLVFDSPKKFHYLAVKENKVFLVEEKIK